MGGNTGEKRGGAYLRSEACVDDHPSKTPKTRDDDLIVCQVFRGVSCLM
jgi:hypothetical protein